MQLQRVLVVSLGGTITMTGSGPAGIQPTLDAADLIRQIPAIGRIAQIEALAPMRVASTSLTLDDLIAVAEILEERLSGDIDGAVVVQGTDTIEESAWLFDLLVRSDRAVVVTGAMRSAEAPGADGPANLLAAVSVAASPQADGRGTLVVLNDEIHAARIVRKSHTALPSAFTSRTMGPLGIVVEGDSVFHARMARTAQIPVPEHPTPAAPVALLRIGLGDDGRLLDALPQLGYRGAVIEGAGAGHVPAQMVERIDRLVQAMPVVLASRVQTGPVFTRTYGYPGSEIDLLRRGVLPAQGLDGLKARVLLSLLLRCEIERAELIEAFVALSTLG